MARILSKTFCTPHPINKQTVNEPAKSLCDADIHEILQVNKLIQVNHKYFYQSYWEDTAE